MTARSSPVASSARHPRSTRTPKTTTRTATPPAAAATESQPQMQMQPPQPPHQPHQQRPSHHEREPHQDHQRLPASSSASVSEQLQTQHHQAQHHQWREHSDHHFVVRKQMIARLQRLHPLLATNASVAAQQPGGNVMTRIPELVQRLELMLYKAASSLDEYLNVCTLERRVHSLVTMLEPLPVPAATVATSSSSRKRRMASNMTPTTKRLRRSCTSPAPGATLVAVNVHTASLSQLETKLDDVLLTLVFAFVDGVDTLRSCSLLNRFFHTRAPQLVQKLHIDVALKSHALLFHGRVARVLAQCGNLHTLTITNSRNDSGTGKNKKKKTSGFMRASPAHQDQQDQQNQDQDQDQDAEAALPNMETAPASFLAATDPTLLTGRVLLHELSDLLLASDDRPVFPRLRTLELRAPFDCANEAESTLAFLHALACNLNVSTTAAQQQQPTGLSKLVLDTTVLGDRRVPRLFAIFHAFPRVFMQQLCELELSNNFVGEAGMRVICDSLQQSQSSAAAWPKLTSLSLRRNILTDGDATQLAHVFHAQPSSGASLLQSVDVSENFIGKPGFQALARSANAHDVRVVASLNCMESSEAAQLFM